MITLGEQDQSAVNVVMGLLTALKHKALPLRRHGFLFRLKIRVMARKPSRFKDVEQTVVCWGTYFVYRLILFPILCKITWVFPF